MNRLSLCMIVKNEERHLEDCLRSVEGVVEEMIIVDTGSTDGTISIAERFGATVISIDWPEDFAAARNVSLRHARGDWILYLDADERLAPGQEGLIKSLIRHSTAYAYALIVSGEHHLPTGVVKQQMAYPRLFRRHPAIRFEGAVHEQITPSLYRLKKKILPTSLVIVHLGYAQSLEVVQEKCRRNIGLLEQQLQRDPEDAYARYQLGNSYSVLAEYGAARRELERACASSQLANSVRASALNLLAEIDIREGRLDSALQHCLSSLRLAPEQVLARWFLAAARIGQGMYQSAIAPLEEILSIQHHAQQRMETNLAHDVTIEDAKVLFQLATCYEHTGQMGKALHSCARVLADEPSFPGAQEAIERYANSISDAAEGIEAVEKAGVFLYPLYKRGVEQALRAGKHTDALSYLEKIVRNNPTVIPAHIKEQLKKLQSAVMAQLPTQQ